MGQILENLGPRDPQSKYPAYYFQASPGVGKTFLLSQLYKKNFPPGYDDKKDELFFLIADFNRDCWNVAVEFKDHFINDSTLFVLLRIYYVECINKSLSWYGFLRNFEFESKNNSFLEETLHNVLLHF